MLSLRNSLHIVRFAIVAAVALATAQIASAAPIDIRVAWDGPNGSGSPNQIAGHVNAATDGYNEILGAFGNGGIQTGGDSPNNLVNYTTLTTTSVNVAWAGWLGTDYGNGAFSATNNWVLRDITGAQLYRNYPAANPVPGTVTFTGLTSGNNYKVEVVMAGVVVAGQWDITIGGGYADHSFSNTQNGAVSAWSGSANGNAQNDWLVWDAEAATGGTLTILLADSPGFTPVDGLAAIRITGELSEASAVPEPATFALAALGLAGLGLVAWRRRKASVE